MKGHWEKDMVINREWQDISYKKDINVLPRKNVMNKERWIMLPVCLTLQDSDIQKNQHHLRLLGPEEKENLTVCFRPS